jgi:hypothetical protein
MDFENILLRRELELLERGLSSLEVTICELRYEIYRIKNPQHIYDEAIRQMEMREDHHESIRL